MSIVQVLLVTLVAIIVTVDYNGPITMIYRPMVAGALVGLVLGDFQQGLIIGATLELMWLGVTAVGGYTPPDTVSGAVVGTALGIVSGHGVSAGIAIAVPVAIITQQLDVLAKTLDIYFVKKADRDAKSGDWSKIDMYQLGSLVIIVLCKVVPIFVALLLGGSYVKAVFDTIPEVVMKGLNVAGSMLPAVGFAMLMTSMLKDKMWPYLLIGFVLSAFLKISTIGLALFGIAFTFITIMNVSKSEPKNVPAATMSNDEEYDL